MKLHSRHKYSISFIADEDINSATMRTLQSSCMRKLKFRYRPEAIRRINTLIDKGVVKGESDFGIYRCRCCGGWHFTSKAHMLDDFDEKIKKLKGSANHHKRSRLNILKAFRDKGYFLPIIHLSRKDLGRNPGNIRRIITA